MDNLDIEYTQKLLKEITFLTNIRESQETMIRKIQNEKDNMVSDLLLEKKALDEDLDAVCKERDEFQQKYIDECKDTGIYEDVIKDLKQQYNDWIV